MKKLDLKTHFLCLYGMMLSDSTIDPRELVAFYELGLKRGVSKEEINEYVLSAGSTLDVPKDMNGKISLLYDLTRIAWADNEIKDEEKELLKKFCVRMHFKEENIDDVVEFFLNEVRKGTEENELLKQINI